MSNSTHSMALAPRIVESSSVRMLHYGLLVVFGVALIAISSKLKVPLWPNPTPVTLQTLAIFTLSAAYGSRLALATLAAYLATGAFGMPVFTGTPEQGLGLAYMAGPTGGYLAGFAIMAWLTGLAADYGWDKNPFKLGAAMLVGEAIMLTMGALWMGYLFGSDKILAWGVGPFIVTDLIKLAIAAAIVPAVWGLFARKR
ncbi:biotin transporter BioY [Salaquimonas pukyongi]|uniref:biotin transporter BioY n=1 Tax=Salaquimonas pukyongi TaxID=2712698 RepID=UPI00096B6D73|nr:biotin transporter BioY [Salaquimonas pukyongi]